jgi:hypothetical protein
LPLLSEKKVYNTKTFPKIMTYYRYDTVAADMEVQQDHEWEEMTDM